MPWVLMMGFLLGVKHALEADHIAAVSALATRSTSARHLVRIAASWGVGHATVLILCGVVVIGLGITVPADWTALVDVGVGLMLIAIGADVLYSVRRGGIHLHVHDHGDGVRHLHVHSHHTESHDHSHRGLLPRALVVGGIHGLAGSAAVVLLSLGTLHSSGAAIAYLMLFGLGSVLGMVLFSMAIAVPAQRSSVLSPRVFAGVRLAVGLGTVLLGCEMALR